MIIRHPPLLHSVLLTLLPAPSKSIFINLWLTGGAGTWYPKPVKEGNANNHKWQQLFPEMQQSCSAFPDTPPTMLSEKGIIMPGRYGVLINAVSVAGKPFLYSIDWSNDNE